MTYQAALLLAVSPDPLESIAVQLKAQLENVVPPDKDACQRLADLAGDAVAVEQAVLEKLKSKTGTQIILTSAWGTRRLVDLEDDGKGVLSWNLGKGKNPVRAQDLALTHVVEFARAQLGASLETEKKIAAFAVMRGEHDAALKLVNALAADHKEVFEQILDLRHAQWREAKAAEEVAHFKDLVAKNGRDNAVALGSQILRDYAGTQALAGLDPPLDAQLAELKSGSADLKRIFMCDARRLPDGRVELLFDASKPVHFMELACRGLPARFTELEAEFEVVPSTEDRFAVGFVVGDTILWQESAGVLNIEQQGKKFKLENALAIKDTRLYRIKAGPAGISFQAGTEKELVVNAPWPGGRLKWGGILAGEPKKLKVVGKLDPQWMAEMAEVIKDRVKFAAGVYVDLKPMIRANAHAEVEQAAGYYFGQRKETHILFGWHEIGSSWTLQGADLISPKFPAGGKFMGAIWPAALVSPVAEVAFEAKIDRGLLDVLVGRDIYAVITNESLKVLNMRISLFTGCLDSEDARLEDSVISEAKRTVAPGTWQRYQVIREKESVTVMAEGVQILKCKLPVGVYPMVFHVQPGAEVMLRNIRIRKLDH